MVGGLGSLAGAFIASLLIGLVQTFAVSINLSVAMCFGGIGVAPPAGGACSRYLERHGGADRARSFPTCCWC